MSLLFGGAYVVSGVHLCLVSDYIMNCSKGKGVVPYSHKHKGWVGSVAYGVDCLVVPLLSVESISCLVSDYIMNFSKGEGVVPFTHRCKGE